MRLGAVHIVAVGVLLRVLVMVSPLQESLPHRVELSTPLTSLPRTAEAVYMSETTSLAATYASELPIPIHTPPLVLGAVCGLRAAVPGVSTRTLLRALCLVCDTVSGLALGAAAPVLLRAYPELGAVSPATAAALMALNPLAIASAAAGSLVSLANVLMIGAFYAAAAGAFASSWVALGLAVYLSGSPVVLVIPAGLMWARSRSGAHGGVLGSVGAAAGGIGRAAAAVGAVVALAAGGSTVAVGGSWAWVERVYGPMVRVADLQPNIGLWWYFHTEMFEHFAGFFVFVFHAFPLVFVAPLTLRFGAAAPEFLWVLLAAITATFKPYPQMGDAAGYLAIAGLFAGLIPHMRYGFLTLNIGLFACAVVPTFWWVWIEAGAGNANFFYNTTLVYAMANVWLILDLVYAKIEHESRPPVGCAAAT